jgi:hypothetical protein
VRPDNSAGENELSLELLADLTPERTIGGRNSTKADVEFYRVGGLGVALKTYSNRGLLVRWLLGRWLIGREVSAYRSASGVEGLPRFLGRLSPISLATEWIQARSLAERSGESIEPAVFDSLEQTLDALHRRGVAVSDLHRGDILLTDDERVFLIDFAIAWTLGERPSRLRRRIFYHLSRLDLIALARIRAHFLGGDVDQAVGRIGGSTAVWHRQGRRIKRLWNRLRGRA